MMPADGYDDPVLDLFTAIAGAPNTDGEVTYCRNLDGDTPPVDAPANKASGEPGCTAAVHCRCEKPAWCTRTTDHEGDHAGYGSEHGPVLVVWRAT